MSYSYGYASFVNLDTEGVETGQPPLAKAELAFGVVAE